jgi:outer membrane protein
MTDLWRGLAVAMLLACHPACAGDEQAPFTAGDDMASASFSSALELALANSPKVLKANASVAVSEQELARAQSVFLPRLDLLAGNQRINALGNVPGLESLLLEGRNRVYNATASLRLSLNIYNGGGDLANYRVAVEKVEEARLSARMQRIAIANVVLDLMHALRQAEIDLRIARMQHGLADRRLAMANESLARGRSSLLSRSEAAYEVQVRLLAMSVKSRAHRSALRNLATVANVPVSALGHDRASSPIEGYVGVLEQSGLSFSSALPEKLINESRLRQARLESRRASASYFPKIDFIARRDYAAVNESGFRSAYNDLAADKGFLGVIASWNLFDGFGTTAGVRSADQQVAIAESDYSITEEDLRRERDELNRALDDAQEDLLVETKRLELMEFRVNISEEKLRVETIDPLSNFATVVERDVQRAEIERRREVVAYHSAKRALRFGRE